MSSKFLQPPGGPPAPLHEEKSETHSYNSKPRKRKWKEHEKKEMLGKEVSKVLAGGSLVNFYNMLPRSAEQRESMKAKKYRNYKQLKINWPFQMIVDGHTGCGKTNLIRNLIAGIGEIDHVFLYAKNLEEPLYKDLIELYEKLGEEAGETLIHASNDITTFPDINEIAEILGNKKGLLIVDDFVNESTPNLKNVSVAYGQGRKSGKAGLSSIFLTQQFFLTPKFIRDNTSLIALGKLTSSKDLTRIVAEVSLDKTVEELKAMHKDIQKQDPMNFLIIDLTKNRQEDLAYKYRVNFAPYVNKKKIKEYTYDDDDEEYDERKYRRSY